VNAQHIKAVPGRKTDVKDSEWIADLLRHGLLVGNPKPTLQIIVTPFKISIVALLVVISPPHLGQLLAPIWFATSAYFFMNSSDMLSCGIFSLVIRKRKI